MKTSAITAIVAALLITSCATLGTTPESNRVTSYTTFSGRLIVIEPQRRWQVSLNWNGTPEKGVVRLTHAASNRIVQLAWQKSSMQILDNKNPAAGWQMITAEKIASYGIILPPQQLAMILHGNMPKRLTQKRAGRWEGRLNGNFLNIRWSDDKRRLEINDVQHGRKAILIIEKPLKP